MSLPHSTSSAFSAVKRFKERVSGSDDFLIKRKAGTGGISWCKGCEMLGFVAVGLFAGEFRAAG